MHTGRHARLDPPRDPQTTYERSRSCQLRILPLSDWTPGDASAVRARGVVLCVVLALRAGTAQPWYSTEPPVLAEPVRGGRPSTRSPPPPRPDSRGWPGVPSSARRRGPARTRVTSRQPAIVVFSLSSLRLDAVELPERSGQSWTSGRCTGRPARGVPMHALAAFPRKRTRESFPTSYCKRCCGCSLPPSCLYPLQWGRESRHSENCAARHAEMEKPRDPWIPRPGSPPPGYRAPSAPPAVGPYVSIQANVDACRKQHSR